MFTSFFFHHQTNISMTLISTHGFFLLDPGLTLLVAGFSDKLPVLLEAGKKSMGGGRFSDVLPFGSFRCFFY